MNDIDVCFALLKAAFPKNYTDKIKGHLEKAMAKKKVKNPASNIDQSQQNNVSKFWTKDVLTFFKRRNKTNIDGNHQAAYDSTRQIAKDLFQQRKNFLDQANLARKAMN